MLTTQGERAALLADALADLGDEDISATMLLDALGSVGYELIEGETAFPAFLAEVQFANYVRETCERLGETKATP